MLVVHSPLVSFKIVEVERFARTGSPLGWVSKLLRGGAVWEEARKIFSIFHAPLPLEQ